MEDSGFYFTSFHSLEKKRKLPEEETQGTKRQKETFLESNVKKLFDDGCFDPTRIYPNEVTKAYFQKMMKSKKFSKKAAIFHLNEPEKNECGIESITVVNIERQWFKELADVKTRMPFLIKVQFADKAIPSKYAQQNDTPELLQGTHEIEYKLTHKLTRPMNPIYWDLEWKSKEEHSKRYEQCEREIIEDFLFRLNDFDMPINILEICGGKGDFAKKILQALDDDGVNPSFYWLVEYSSVSCVEARRNLAEFEQAIVVQSDILKTDFKKLTKMESPTVIIASGALTLQVLSDRDESKYVLKQLFSVMSDKGLIYLTGLQNQLTSHADIKNIFPFRTLKTADSQSNEFLVLQKDDSLEFPTLVNKEGELDLFYFLLHKSESSLCTILNSLSPVLLAKIKTLDLSLCHLSEEDMSTLVLLPNLRSLKCAGVENMEALLAHIPKVTLNKLKKLDLSYTQVTDRTLIKYLGDTRISKLSLTGCEQISTERQLELMLFLQKGKVLDLTIANRRVYAEYFKKLNELMGRLNDHSLFEERMVNYKTVRIPMSKIYDHYYQSQSPAQQELYELVLKTATRYSAQVEIVQDISNWESKRDDADLKKFLTELNRTQLGELGIYQHELVRIKEFLDQNQDRLLALAHEQGEPQIVKRREGSLPRTIEFYPDGSVTILLKTKNLPLVGSGKNKKVKYSYDITHQRQMASYSFSATDEFQFRYMELLTKSGQTDPLKGLVKVFSVMVAESSKLINKKIHVNMELYPHGNLNDFISKTQISNLEKQKLCLDIFEGALTLHSLGLVHLDLHTKNVFIKKEQEQFIAGIGDFGLIRKIETNCEENTQPLGVFNISCSSPEILSHLYGEIMGPLPVSEKADVWMMGLLLAEVYGISVPFMTNSIINPGNLTPTDINNMYHNIIRNPFPEPQDQKTLEYLIWNMLRINREERITLFEAREKFKAIDTTQINRHPVVVEVKRGYINLSSLNRLYKWE